MLSNESYDETNPDYDENKIDEQLEQKICITNLCIPKVEPCYLNVSRSSEDTLSASELMTSSIPYSVPYKIKDPIVLLERCDKIWETLQLIKNAQDNSSSELSPKQTNSKSYIKYHPVLSNDNAALPNFVFSVKTTKKLFQCSTCGKLYTKHLTLRQHAEKVHRIFMNPLRNKHCDINLRSIDKEGDRERRKRKECERQTERESNVIEKEKKDNEQVHSKRNENIFTDSLSRSTIVSSTEQDIFNHKRLKTRTSVLVHPNNNVNETEISHKKEEKRISGANLQQNEKQTSLHHDSALVTCLLCKQGVKNIGKHLIDYHKIEYSDFMRELEKSSSRSEFEELNSSTVSNKSLKERGTVPKYSPVQEKEKRKSSISPVDSTKKRKIDNNGTLKVPSVWQNNKRQCDICLGVYSRNSFYKHVNRHRLRGETKENMQLLNSRCSKSTSGLKQKESLNLNKDKYSSISSKKKEVKGQALQNLNKEKQGCNTTSNDNYETRCSCGKLFNTPQGLAMHKRSCTLKMNKIPTMENNLDESILHDKQQGNKDSSPGINITIKKKNNSYEIVGKDSENESNLQGSSQSKNTEKSDISRDNEQIKSPVQSPDLASSKYSKYHSIVKIQVVEEDVDIDIENELQTKSCNNNITEMNELVNELHKEEENTEKVSTLQSKEVNSNWTRERILEMKQINANKFNMSKKYICVCGNKFYNKKALDVHIDKHQTNSELRCAYCKKNFVDINIWNKHECSVTCCKKFIDLPTEIHCYYCSTIATTQKQFDDHIRLKHFDTVMPYQCFGCSQRFPTAALRKLHFNAEHAIIICSICQRKIPNWSNAKSKHEGYHYGLGFPCHVCKKTYSSQNSLSRHKINVHCKIVNEIMNSSEPFFINSKIQSLDAKKQLGKKSLTHFSKDIELES
ncbi:uncharacterized protein LOC114872344 isoform X1 [Osmia bicornis bicornis]|uniref:uncharacterized protein LOC114872344 isoform X1 n=2 Tax=Osmia bicornis bicornis TaxID=1437191 RepID=UPI001EAEC5BE|nr:uncharacterized protein LOC114872344 isoform X1 [Osmia bicornis bicornis]XP_046140912.1 uncharacterized protein LOC114872344 isoform X1 [Osmia bicornis bicornis]XP_046140913.1 uncharacterized protein LOC114872344 isoform X1 [Osmia bicornis bicornis]XP_046140914.1 uncharacterized protein LOC114872344 isoform X1 [Osmia bicornis bicornis]XP_046140915.1 uncharacterized protein LOC114872344 isoform X1 [Osmia bicornis bicornis]XP_046140916.1 uncharacterized protein LOC114872344 isoform X1 [Osmia 